MELAQLISVIKDSAAVNSTRLIPRPDYEQTLLQTLHQAKPIKVITGLRRSGKSLLLKQLYQKLLAEGIPSQNLFFVNFEHDQVQELLSLTGIREMYNLFSRYADPDKPQYLFLDELQNVEGWSSFVRTIYDSTSHHLYLTGSNSKLLSSEFASTLGGRVLELFVQPFSMQEVASFKEISATNQYQLAQHHEQIQTLFRYYLDFGGIPEVLSLPSNQALSYRQTLIDKILLNDVIKYYKLDLPDLLRTLAQYFERTVGSILSVRNIALSANANEKTVASYIGYLCNSYLLNYLKKYEFKARAQLSTQPKLYSIDNLFAYRADDSQKLENVVYAHLVRKFGLSYLEYARDSRGKEVDFLVRNYPNYRDLAVQTCWTINDRNFHREISALELFKKYDRSSNTRYLLVYCNMQLKEKQLPAYIRAISAPEFLMLDEALEVTL